MRDSDMAPVVVEGVDGAVHIALGDDHACAVIADGEVLCWGEDAHGALGWASAAWEISIPE